MEELTQPILRGKEQDSQATQIVASSPCTTSNSSESSEGDDEVSGLAGVVSGEPSSHRKRDHGSAGVVPGGNDWFRKRMAHTNCPWLVEFNESMSGYERDGKDDIPLFDCAALQTAILPRSLPENERHLFEMKPERYLVDVFFQKRFFRAYKRQDPYGPSTPDSLCEAWQYFHNQLETASSAWFETLTNYKACYMRSLEGLKMAIHERSIAEGVSCCVTRRQHCPMCYNNSPKATEDTRAGTDSKISRELVVMVRRWDRRWNECAHKRKRQVQRQEDSMKEARLDYAQVDLDWIRQELRDLGTKSYEHDRAIEALDDKAELAEDKELDQRSDMAELKEQMAELRSVLYKYGLLHRRDS